MRQYACSSYDKRICALLFIISNVVQNVNLIAALHSALCDSSYCFNVVQYPSYDKRICALLLIISNVNLSVWQYACIKIVQYTSIDKCICELLLIISNAVQNVNLSVALHSTYVTFCLYSLH